MNVGSPLAAASAATRRYSPGDAPGAYPTSRPIPSAPSATSASSSPRTRPISAAEAARRHRGSARLANSGPIEPSNVTPASTSILASAQDAANP